MTSKVFILPGLNNSGPQHWQTAWEQEYGFTRIQQKEWDAPVCEDWIRTIEEATQIYPPGDLILVGHSLACCTIIHWAQKFRHPIKGALLVGPSDVDAPSYPEGTTGFNPMPLHKLPFPSIVIASSNDPYVTLERAEFFAGQWGSKLVNIGDRGHINTDSTLGNWPIGYEWLQALDQGIV